MSSVKPPLMLYHVAVLGNCLQRVIDDIKKNGRDGLAIRNHVGHTFVDVSPTGLIATSLVDDNAGAAALQLLAIDHAVEGCKAYIICSYQGKHRG